MWLYLFMQIKRKELLQIENPLKIIVLVCGEI